MASETADQGALSVASESGKTKDTMSQFVARVLDQLSLSAWLPSAALIVAIAFVFQLGAVLDSPGRPHGAADVIGQAFARMAGINLGGAALFTVGVVVITMVTQAFQYEAIRLLEGYWGTNVVVERVAQWRCSKFRRQRLKLETLRKELTEKAWKGARDEFERRERVLAEQSKPPQLTPDMIAVMGAGALGHPTRIVLTEAEKRYLKSIQWRSSAPAEPMRRLINISKRLRNFPEPGRMMPTKLGNVLRSYEDSTEKQHVQDLVQEIFDDLPLSLRVEHDEQRGRLDLYCSMVFVLLPVAIVAVTRLASEHPLWCVGAVVLLLLADGLMYRSAIAAAQAYGAILLTIAKRVS